MALDGSSATFLPYTLNGLQDIAVDSSTVSTLQVNSLTPNRVVVSDGSDFLVSAGATSTEVDYLSGTTSNIQTQLNSKASVSYVDTNFLNKTTISNQTVAGKVQFQDVITNSLQSIFNSGLKITNPTLGSWVISVEYIDAYSQNLLFYNTVSGATIRFTGDYGYMKSLGWGPSKVMITNSSSELVSSGVDSIKITYLDNVSSDIQTQLNSKLNLSGSNANQDIVLGGYKIQSSATPTVGNDLTPKSYVDSAVSGLGAVYVLKAGDTMTGALAMGANKITTTYTPVNADDLTRKGWVDGQLALKCQLSGGNTISGNQTYSDQTASRVAVFDASKNLVSSSVSSTTLTYLDIGSSLTGLLNAKANLAGGNTFTGAQTFSDQTASTVPIFNASKQLVSSSVSSTTLTYLDIGSSLTGLLNTKANLAGSNTFTGTNTFSSATPITLSGLTASRALALNASGNIVVSTTTSTELGYLSGTTSSVQTQLNTLTSTFANYLPLTGGTLTGLLKITPSSTGNRKLVLYDGGLNNDFQYYGFGINDNTLRFNVPVASTDRFSFFGGTGTTSATEVFRINGTGALESGVSMNTTANLKMSSSASHIDNNAGEVYLFTGFNGHLGIQRNTTRNATTACLALGTADTEESELISYKADGSGFMPLSYAGSVHTWVSGNSTDVALTSYTFRGQTGFDGSNFVNLQCQASQYGRNQLIMTGRYEASNDAWSFTAPRNAIRFRTQSSLNSAYTNRWTIQNFADKLGFLSSSGGNTPRVVFTDGGLVGIGTDSPSTLLEIIGATTLFSLRDTTANSYSAMRLGNDSGYGCYWFLNGSSRTADGGISTATLRNDLGNLRLQSSGGNGFTIDATSGYTRQYGGDTSKILFGPNTTWSAYLVVGAGTNEVAANKAQLISTNGNWHQDAGLGKDTYINYYQGQSGQGNNPGNIYSYGLNWYHTGNSTVSGRFTVGSTSSRTLMSLSGGSNGTTPGFFGNIGSWPDAANGCLYSQDTPTGANSAGLFMGYNSSNIAGYITSLAPGVAWLPLRMFAAETYVYYNGSLCAYTQSSGWVNVSDEREKEDIQPLKTGKSLDRVLALRPKHYRRKYREDSPNPVSDDEKQKRHIGFIAQEVQQSNPHCISTWCNSEAKEDETEDDGSRLGMMYNDIIVHLVGAVQEQQKTINLLSERNQLLEEHARKLESDFAEYTLQTDRRMTQLAELVRSMLEDQQPKLKRNKTIVRE